MEHLIMTNLVFDVPRGNTTLVDFVGYINSLTDFGFGGIIGLTFLIVISSIVFFMTRTQGNERALALSFILTAFLSVLLRILNLITDKIMSICIVLAFIGLWLLIKEDDKYEV